MKVLLANMPWQRQGRCGVRAGSRWPHIKDSSEGDYMPFPFFLAYSASLLKKNNFEVKLIDAIAEGLSEEQFLKDVRNFDPDLILIETSTVSLEEDLAFIEKIDKKIPVALCGPDVNIRQEEFLRENKRISYILKGEYEFTLLDLVKHLGQGSSLENVLGLNFRKDDGYIYINPPRSLINNLDELPWPLREGLPMNKYLDAPGGMPLPSVQMLASRGCPYGCIFCLWPQVMYGGRNYRVRNPKDVVDEMAYLVNQMKFRSIYFDDDTFGLSREWVLKFVDELKERNSAGRINVPWAMMARADIMDEEILEKMKSVGLFALKYGIESANQGLVNSSGKNLDLNKAIEIVEFTKKLGIKVHLTFMFGLPGETKETIRRTIDLALVLDPASVQFSIATPFPGTIYFDELDKMGMLISKRWSDYDGNHKVVFKTCVLSAEELKEAKNSALFLWSQHCKRRGDYFFNSLIKKFFLNIKIRGIIYTTKKIIGFVKRKRPKLSFYFNTEYKKFTILSKIKQRIHNYINMMGILRGSHAYIGPYLAQIDLTNNCNNNCVGCWCNSPLLAEKHISQLEKNKMLPYALVKDLIDELHNMYTKEIFLSGGGEPFMHPNIMDIVRYIKKMHMVCYINTNFTLLDKNKVHELVELGVDHLTVSLWAGTPKAYVLTHPNKDENAFFKIREMLKFMSSLRKKGTPPYIKLYNVICNVNYYDIVQMIEFALDTEVDSVEFTVIDTIPGKTDVLLMSDKERKILAEKCEEIKYKFSNSLNNNGLMLSQFDQFLRRILSNDAITGQYDKNIIDSIPCYVGRVFTRILADGNVNACLKAHRIPVGNIYKQKFKEIWNGPLQKEFRSKTKRPKKEDPIFSCIGNDPDIKVGCYKSCDDIDRNLQIHKRLGSLSPAEKIILKSVSKIIGDKTISRPEDGKFYPKLPK